MLKQRENKKRGKLLILASLLAWALPICRELHIYDFNLLSFASELTDCAYFPNFVSFVFHVYADVTERMNMQGIVCFSTIL